MKNVFGIRTEKSLEQLNREHLLYLASCENHYQMTVYPTSSENFKANSIKRILKYIANRTAEEKAYKEYKVFIKAMEKSIAMCKEV